MLPSIEQCLKQATTQLTEVSDSPQLDAEVLLADILKKNRSFFRAFPEQNLTESEFENFHQLLVKRSRGTPIAHILGRREFWSLDLQVNEHTLIPRPDTEVLIEFILQHLSQPDLKVADLGTGTGAIALALASEKSQWNITATEQSDAALDIARKNADSLKLTNIQFKQGNWFQALDSNNYDLIISNPPYIPSSDPHLLQGDVRFEPIAALASGKDGLDDIRHLIKNAHKYLSANGWLILEHGYDQKVEVFNIFQSSGFMNIIQKNDYASNPRLTAAQFCF